MTKSTGTEFSLADIEIRLAGDDDRATISRLFEQSLAEGQVRANDTGADVEYLTAGYLDDEGHSGFWVAEHNGEIVAMIGVQRTSPDMAEIRRLRVLPEYRRRGLGTLLMKHALEFCKHHGYLKITLDVRIDHAPAIALFEKFGFSLARQRDSDGRAALEFYLDLYRDRSD